MRDPFDASWVDGCIAGEKEEARDGSFHDRTG
jgi:hypothetical protein